MDKNIAALLREDSKTISVRFDSANGSQSKGYTYVTHLDVKAGDRVVVDARGEMKIAYVQEVHNDLQIEPNSNTKCKWVVDVIRIKEHLENEERNEQIEAVVAKSYRKNVRQSFAAHILASLGDDASNVAGLLSAKKED